MEEKKVFFLDGNGNDAGNITISGNGSPISSNGLLFEEFSFLDIEEIAKNKKIIFMINTKIKKTHLPDWEIYVNDNFIIDEGLTCQSLIISNSISLVKRGDRYVLTSLHDNIREIDAYKLESNHIFDVKAETIKFFDMKNFVRDTCLSPKCKELTISGKLTHLVCFQASFLEFLDISGCVNLNIFPIFLIFFTRLKKLIFKKENMKFPPGKYLEDPGVKLRKLGEKNENLKKQMYALASTGENNNCFFCNGKKTEYTSHEFGVFFCEKCWKNYTNYSFLKT